MLNVGRVPEEMIGKITVAVSIEGGEGGETRVHRGPHGDHIPLIS